MHRVVLTLVVDRADPLPVQPLRRRAVGGDGVRTPGVPDALGGLHESLGVGVPVGMVQVATAAEVLPGPGVVRGDDVPGRPSPGEQVQGVQPVSQVRRVVVGGVLRGHQPDLAGDLGQGCQHGLGVGPADHVEVVHVPEVFAQPQSLPEEEGGEQSTFGGLGQVPEGLEVSL